MGRKSKNVSLCMSVYMKNPPKKQSIKLINFAKSQDRGQYAKIYSFCVKQQTIGKKIFLIYIYNSVKHEICSNKVEDL